MGKQISDERKMNFKNDSKVWVEDKELAWVAGDVTDVNGNKVHVLTVTGMKVVVEAGKVNLRDADEDDHGGVDDMIKLTYLNEPDVLYNLERRYALNEIYTYTGSILIAVNPFMKLPHLYNVHMMEQYKGAPFGELNPHVFAVADASYRAMISDGKSQSILVSGESGAGKTETTKLIMQYLTYVGGRAAGGDRTVEQKVLESNPLLEAFGNAKTARNDNSSRFGKFVEIQFDRNGRISGAAIRSYLLERSRVVKITDPERNYHCFYQLCASGRDAEKFKLGHPSTFFYLNQSKAYDLNGVSNAEEYVKTRRAMDVVGISSEDQEAIFRTLAAILHLGNIDFSPGKEHDSSVLKDERSSFHMQMAADLFMCNVQLLLATLCTRIIQTREGNIVKALDCNAAVSSRDALAKTVYARLFDWLVDKINRSVDQDPNSLLQVGVLDIYGFECFWHNSFEQFCINFANEKLQQHFNEHVFKMEQEEYSKEAINWSYIEFIDNQDVLDLIEKKPIGIIALLDEACMFPKSTHETLSMKLFHNFRSHPRLEKTKFSETDFSISHYAGKVTYQTQTFIEKNRDYVVMEHCNLLSSSKCPFISGLFPTMLEESSRSSYKFSSVSSRFKQQLQALMETLNLTEPHYVRCIKPNSLHRPQKFEKPSILHQLRCGGVLEAIRISLAGYPTRRSYSEFVDRFGILALDVLDESHDEKLITEKILQRLKLDNFQLGKTKVFLRAGQIGILDSRRSEVLNSSAKCIQRKLRSFLARRDFLSAQAASVVLQAYWRGCLARKIFEVKRMTASAILIQKYIRGWKLRHAYVKVLMATLVVQSCIRGFSMHQKFVHQKKHRVASLIQARWRIHRSRRALRHHQASVIAVQCLWRRKLAKRELKRLRQEANEAGALRLAKNNLEKQLEDLTWRLQLEKRLRVSNEEAKVVEASKLQQTLESLNLELDAAKLATVNECNKNAVLQTQLELLMNEKYAFERELALIAELREENACLKSSLDAMDSNNAALEFAFTIAKEETEDTIGKLREVEEKSALLQENVNRLEAKLLNLENKNHVLRQKALGGSPRGNRTGLLKAFSEMSGSRMKVAGRFTSCIHMGCFDLEVFVEMNQRSRKWQCPICLKNYSLENIIIDPYFNRITSLMKHCGEDVTEIEVKPDGSWRVKTKTEAERRELGDLVQWHLPDSTLGTSTDEKLQPKADQLKPIKQEGVSDGHIGLKLGIKKNRDGFWEVSKPDDPNYCPGNRFHDNFGDQEPKVIPMSSSATGSGRDGEDPSVNQDGGGNFDFSVHNGIELDSTRINGDHVLGFTDQNPSALIGAEIIVLSDSDDENDLLVSSGDMYRNNGQSETSVINFSIPQHVIADSFEDPTLGTGGNSCLGLFNPNDDDFGEMSLWLPAGSQAGPGFQLFGADADVSDALADLQHGSMNGYSLAPENTIDTAALPPDNPLIRGDINMSENLVDNPLAIGRDDPSLQIFLPTRPSSNASAPSDSRERAEMSNGLHEDWISLRVGGDATGGPCETPNANGFNHRQQIPSAEGPMDPLDTASLLLGMNDNRSEKAHKQRSDDPFSFPRQKRSVRARLFFINDSDTE